MQSLASDFNMFRSALIDLRLARPQIDTAACPQARDLAIVDLVKAESRLLSAAARLETAGVLDEIGRLLHARDGVRRPADAHARPRRA